MTLELSGLHTRSEGAAWIGQDGHATDGYTCKHKHHNIGAACCATAAAASPQAWGGCTTEYIVDVKIRSNYARRACGGIWINFADAIDIYLIVAAGGSAWYVGAQ